MCSLPIDSSLQDGKYIIKSKISQEGLCITYQAIQTSLNRVVIIKEFYMRDFCSRENDNNNVIVGNNYAEQVDVFKLKFLSDAKSNARGDIENEIKVFDVFEENNTAYYVFLGNEDIVIEEQKEEEIEVTAEETQIAEKNITSKEDEATTIELNIGDVEVVKSPKEAIRSTPEKSFWENYKKTIFICSGLVVGGFICASLAIHLNNNSNTSDELAELEDTTVVDEVIAVDSVVYDNDMQGAELTDNSQQEYDEYINLSNEWLSKAQNNLHKPSNVQNILNARYYYYDKADKINVALKGERLPANKEIDELTEQEYQYWVNEAKKCGSAKSKYELKRTYLTRAKSLAFRHQNLLDSQIKWLDEQLAKQNRKRR